MFVTDGTLTPSTVTKSKSKVHAQHWPRSTCCCVTGTAQHGTARNRNRNRNGIQRQAVGWWSLLPGFQWFDPGANTKLATKQHLFVPHSPKALAGPIDSRTWLIAALHAETFPADVVRNWALDRVTAGLTIWLSPGQYSRQPEPSVFPSRYTLRRDEKKISQPPNLH